MSGGAVRGIAHLGVIRVLEEHGIPIHCVAGTSAGSLSGVFLAAGFTAEQQFQIARKLAWGKLAGITVPAKGLFDGRVMEEFINEELRRENIEELDMPYAAVAVDLSTGELAVFDHGPIAPAVRASCAIPGVFTPLEIDDHVYVDGGVLSFAPVPQARALGADYIIAVNLVPPKEPKRRPANLLEVLLATFELNMRHVANLEPSGDVEIRPELTGTDMYDFGQRELLIQRGEEAARLKIEQIEADLKSESTRKPFWKRN